MGLLAKAGVATGIALVYLLKVEANKVLEALWSVEDRSDKCGNKLEVIERRLEALQAEYKDFSRHLTQAYQNYRAEGKNPEVLGSWISYLKESWTEGRLRVMRDASEEACPCSLHCG